MAISALLETEDRDLALFEGGLVLVRDARAIAQRVENRYRFFLGEWFLDTRLGMPYFQQILGKVGDLSVLRQLFVRVATSTPGISDVTEFTMEYDPGTRGLQYAWVGTTTTGDIVSSDNAFIVTENP